MPAHIVSPSPDAIQEAALRLLDGHLVAFPTETVYGLGANALDADAVARIFAVKGRPSTNPVIVHVADAQAAHDLVGEWMPLAQKLADAFWPGPLTLVLPKAADVPDIVTAGGQTVGVRVPHHHVALELLQSAGVPIAAPSANRSEEVSPTTAQHVADSLGAFVDDLLVLDGGPCRVGLESTVLDVTGDVPRILRPGMVTAQMLREVVGDVLEGGPVGGPERSPGQMVRHYAPRAPVMVVSSKPKHLPFLEKLALFLPVIKKDGDVLSGSLRVDKHFRVNKPIKVFEGKRKHIMIPMSPIPEEYAALLYAALRELDEAGVSVIFIQEPPDTPEWAAVHDRLRRAAAKKDDR